MKKLAFSVLTLWMTIWIVHPVLAEAPAFFNGIDCGKTVEEYDYQCRRFGDGDKRIPLSEIRYSFWTDLWIPGMPGTIKEDAALNRIPGENVIPQGIALAGDYIIISAYSEEKEYPGCLFLFDRTSKAYLATLGMQKGSHLGGIAFDGENLWVCHSSKKALQRIPYAYLQAVGRKRSGCVIDISEESELYPINNTPSCVTYFNGRLYVATMTLLFRSEMISYRYENGALLEENLYPIPPLVQGVAFTERGEVFLSTSYGRRNSSHLKRYSNLTELTRNFSRPSKVIELTPCSEEILIDGDSLLVVFESAAEKYYKGTDGLGKSRGALDKVLTIELDSVP